MRTLSLLCFVLLTPACGDDDAPIPGADSDAAVPPADAGVGVDAPPPPPPLPPPPPGPTGAAGWERLDNTSIAPHCPDEPSIRGASGCSAVTAAWSGAAMDTRRDRLVITGGGHNDYYGNELYGLDVGEATMRRLTEPGLPGAPGDPCEEAVADGTQPNSRHTYDGIEYLEGVDRMWIFSGSLACGYGAWGQVTWTFDFGAMRWDRMNPSGDLPTGEAGMMAEYDPVTELLFVHDRQHLHSYDATRDEYTRVSEPLGTGLGYHHTGVIDPQRRLFVAVGWSSIHDDGRVFLWDISDVEDGSAAEHRELVTTGGEPAVDAGYPGLAYDPIGQSIVAWAGGDTVYTLDPDTGQWEAHEHPGGPMAVDNGTMGRFRYSAALDAFVVVNAIDADAYLFRLPRD